MLPYFPAAYPDELLYSLLARYHRHTCSLSPKRTLDDLFDSRNVRATVDLPGHLGVLSRRLPPDRGLTSERLAIEFTLFPYHAAFQRPAVVAGVLAAMTEGAVDGIHMRLGIAASTISVPATLRYCPACHREALARWGERYWRRAHQLPGVLVCPDHGVPLVDSAVTSCSGHQHEFIAADDRNCGSPSFQPRWIDDQPCRTILLEIARRSTELLGRPPRGQSPADLTACYRRALIDRRLASANGRVSQRRLHDAFDAAFAPVRAALPDVVAETSWLSSIVRKHRHAFHPLRHVLFGLFLDGCPPVPAVVSNLGGDAPNRRRVAGSDFDDRLREFAIRGEGLRPTARALGVDPNTVRRHTERLGLDVAWRPLVRPSPPAKEDRGPAIRERWLELQRREPHLGRKALADRLPAEHAWLFRHDRAWMDAHSPAPTVRPHPADRVNWKATDHSLSIALHQAAESTLALVPPVRVTLAELERRLGRSPGWIGKRRHKLPEALAVLSAVAESVEAFQLRRIAWAGSTLERSGESAPAWKIRRLAGLPGHLSDTVRQALAVIEEDQMEESAPCR